MALNYHRFFSGSSLPHLTTQIYNNTKYNKFILLLRKNVYPNKYMNVWEKFNKT